MYSQIIHHRNVKSFELLAKAIFFALARDGIVYRNYQEIIDSIKNADFQFFDDNYFYKKIFDYYKTSTADEQVKGWISRLFNRKPLKVISEIKKLNKGEEYYAYKTFFFSESFLKVKCSELGISYDDVIPNEIIVDFVPIDKDFLDKMRKDKYILPAVDHVKIEKAVEQYKLSPRLYIEESPDHSEMLVSDTSSFVGHLSQLELIIIAIYFTSEDEDAKSKLMKSFNIHLKSIWKP